MNWKHANSFLILHEKTGVFGGDPPVSWPPPYPLLSQLHPARGQPWLHGRAARYYARPALAAWASSALLRATSPNTVVRNNEIVRLIILLCCSTVLANERFYRQLFI